MLIVMPRCFSSGALSISSNAMTDTLGFCSARTLVMAAVSVVLPWSMWPIVPTFRCGLLRSNFALPMAVPTNLSLLSTLLLRPRLLQTRGGRTRLFAPNTLDDLFLHARRGGLVRIELHGVRGPTLGPRTKVGSVAEHLGQRHLGPDRLRVAPLLHAADLAPAGREVAHDVAHVVLGRDHLDRHDRLEDDRVGLASGLLEGHRTGNLERHLRRV